MFKSFHLFNILRKLTLSQSKGMTSLKYGCKFCKVYIDSYNKFIDKHFFITPSTSLCTLHFAISLKRCLWRDVVISRRPSFLIIPLRSSWTVTMRKMWHLCDWWRLFWLTTMLWQVHLQEVKLSEEEHRLNRKL